MLHKLSFDWILALKKTRTEESLSPGNTSSGLHLSWALLTDSSFFNLPFLEHFFLFFLLNLEVEVFCSECFLWNCWHVFHVCKGILEGHSSYELTSASASVIGPYVGKSEISVMVLSSLSSCKLSPEFSDVSSSSEFKLTSLSFRPGGSSSLYIFS